MSIFVGALAKERCIGRSKHCIESIEIISQFKGNSVEVYSSENIFMTCNNQWITPESVNEHLPICDEQDSLVIVSDSILDNRSELFERLQVKVPLRSKITDNELILLAYKKWGDQSAKYLVGDFSYVIWDKEKNQLFGARDLLGNRVLYYTYDSNQFSFSNLISLNLKISGVKKEIEEIKFAEFLAIPTMLDSVDMHTTFYKNIKQLPPGHYFVYKETGLQVHEYDALVPNEKQKYSKELDYIEEFKDIFRLAVGSRTRTFKNVGATLSGGLDSGAVVAYASEQLKSEGRTLYTYSYVPTNSFVDWTPSNMLADETPYINDVVNYLENVRASYQDFPDKNPITEIDDMLKILEYPYKNFENSYWIKGIYEIAASQNIGTLLTGARGNFTISWGSAIEYYAQLIKHFKPIKFYKEISLYGKTMRVSRKKIVSTVQENIFNRFAKNSEFTALSLINPDYANRTKIYQKLDSYDVGLRPSAVTAINERAKFFEDKNVLNLQGQMAAKFSLNHSLWERDATSDSRIVKFCLSLPLEEFVKEGYNRFMVRQSTKGMLPDSVRLNQRKRGIQGVDWLHRVVPKWNIVLNELDNLCKDDIASQYLDVSKIEEYLVQYKNPPAPQLAINPDLMFLFRSLIVYRFLQQI